MLLTVSFHVPGADNDASRAAAAELATAAFAAAKGGAGWPRQLDAFLSDSDNSASRRARR